MLGFLLVTTARATDAGERAEAPRRRQLVRLIETRREQVAERDREVRLLRDQVAQAREVVLERARRDEEHAERSARLADMAGTTALRGPGLVVKLSDSDQPARAEEAGAYRIHDTDLQLVVNALFEAGAEAVAVNDSRLVATSPIRSAGDTIVVNFRPLSPPYEVVAIGAERDRFTRSSIARRFAR